MQEARETTAKSPAKFSISPHETKPGKDPKNANILIVEDDALSLELMRNVLAKNGYEVTLASSGIEAVEACSRSAFDLIFMDLQMPGMDGFATAEKIREVEQTSGRRAPIVALTASNVSGRAYQYFKTEFSRILTKPFEIPTILQTIEDLTRQSGHRDEPGEIMDIRSALPHFGLDVDQFREIFAEFQESLPGRLEDMERSLRENDLIGLARHAHNLKGVAANVGAMQLSNSASRLDDAADQADTTQIQKWLAQIRTDMRQLQENAQGAMDAFFENNSHTMREK